MSLLLVLITLPVLAQAMVAVVLGFVAATRRRSAPALPFAALMFSIAIWSLGNALEKWTPTADGKLFWANVQYLGAAFVPIAWATLGVAFTGRSRWLSRPVVALLAAFPLIFIALTWTNEYHGLVREATELRMVGESFTVLRSRFGRLFWAHIAFSYAAMAVGALLMLETAFRGHGTYRAQASAMLVGAVIPWLTNGAHLFHWLPDLGFDPTVLSFGVTVFAAAWCMYHFRFLDLIPVARANVVESMPDGVVVLDDEGRILDINRAACAFLGADAKVIGRPFDELLRGCVAELAAATESSKYPRELVLESQGKRWNIDLTVSPIGDRGGRSIGLVILFRDVTARRAAERSERASQANWRSLLEEASDAIFVFDAEGTIGAANRRGCEMLGYAEEELLGSNLYALLPAEERAANPLTFATLATGTRLLTERSFRHRDGRAVWAELSATLLPDGRHLAIVRDITERKAADEERRRLEAELQHSQKLESLGVLAGGIAHDFNNLLVGILGNAGLALADLPPASSARRAIEQLEIAAKRASELCRQMLAYSGRGTLEKCPIELAEVIREMIDLLVVSTSKKVQLRYDFAREPCVIEGDAVQLQQLIMNLITNASEAMGKGSGTVTARIRSTVVDQEMLADGFIADPIPSGNYVRLEVADDGPGMDPQTKARIFEPFFSTKFTGRGLGLSAVLGIVRRHQGAIRVDSTPGAGTVVTVLLPRSAAPAVAVSTPSADWQNYRGSGTILVVDDEEAVRNVAQRILARFGFDVILAADGVEAVDAYARLRERIDAVLLDWTMPRMNGEETWQELRRINPNVCVILSSGFNENDAADQFGEHGFSAFLQKPYGPADLLRKLTAVLGADADLARAGTLANRA